MQIKLINLMGLQENKIQHRVFAIVGKGGSGKTTFTSLFSNILIKKGMRPLLIDADPTMSHLSITLGKNPENISTIEKIKKIVVKTASTKNQNEKINIANSIDEIIRKSLIIEKNYSLLVMGQPESAGCFCPSNTLLRMVIEDIINDYEIVLIDCEAGIEQIQRNVIRSVDYLIIITDTSLRSIETARIIKQKAKKFTNYKEIGLVINRINKKNINSNSKLNILIKEIDIPILGEISEDSTLTDFELNGTKLDGIPNNSLCMNDIEKIVKKLLINNYKNK